MKLRIALDTNVGKRRYEEFVELGYTVVVVAQESEPDEDWLQRAFVDGARFIVSNDVDVPKIIEREGYPMCWIKYPNDNPKYKDWLVQYVDQMIRFKLIVFKAILEEAK